MCIFESEEECMIFWVGCKVVFFVVGWILLDYLCMDGIIFWWELFKVLVCMCELFEKYGLGVVNVFYVGDGNLYLFIFYDVNKFGELDVVEVFGVDILRLCVEVGGVLIGEYGVGIEKCDLMMDMFFEVDLK